MSSQKRPSSSSKFIAYQEFGSPTNPDALKRTVPDLPPQQQNIRVQATRSGRKGKTVTVITGFQHTPETLTKLLKQLKSQCGSGGTVKENTLEIQGDHRQQLVDILGSLGYKVKISGG
ncbi:translation initiation factor SUI1 [Rippkaea orientalis PCC 8801]|uniref:Translation initiation factor SUI1 n=1 Tax=Rippkaea orientalis (strain PCC 8801 / RF-1) TaxID=41431 RepID=B7JXE5_RIPO1|nr:translation initiation factor [Rippkaea orientalis]ACK67133.1 translation initiation factor SUI1 [Rippkaea orientalis PCC 8801]